MNTDNSSQPTPTLPAHYEFLSHPLVREPESPSHVGCLDILHNSTYLLDLISAIDVDGQSDGGGLSTEGANAFYWLTHTLRNTLRYVSLTLRDIEAVHAVQHDVLKTCAFVQALHDSDEVYQKNLFSALAACLGVSAGDIEEFVTLLN